MMGRIFQFPKAAASPEHSPAPERFTTGADEARRRLPIILGQLKGIDLELKEIAGHAEEHQREPVDLFELLRERHRRPSTLDRILEALGDSRFFYLFIGFYCGMMLTVGFAYLWSVA